MAAAKLLLWCGLPEAQAQVVQEARRTFIASPVQTAPPANPTAPNTSATVPQASQAAPTPTEPFGSGRSSSVRRATRGGESSAADMLPGPGQTAGSKGVSTSAGAAADSSSTEAAVENQERLQLADVVASIYRAHPIIEQARLERNLARGLLVEAYGAYDTKLQGYSLSEPTGFYENFRNGIGVARQTWWGGYLSAGYRIGRGEFQPWYKERETNEAGEFKLAMGIPLLQGRAIDPQRVAVFQASLANQAAEPMIRQSLLFASMDAAMIYWEWVAAGAILEAQRELLALAEQRGEQLEAGVKADKFAEVDLIFNLQLIAERKGKVLESLNKFRAVGFKLSLFLRDEVGQPMVPNDEWLPNNFPIIKPLPPSDFQTDLTAALSRRPEPMLLQFEMRQIQWDQQLAINQLMPQLDLVSEASQDVGIPASSSNDKGDFELLVGVQGEVPIQRRKARGKIQSTSAKLAQLDQKLRFQRDKIGAELQTAYAALILSAQVVEQAELALRAAVDTLSRYRFAFDRGSDKVDLIYINLLESKVNETEIKLLEAQGSWFSALAQMQAALGLDPLDQAMLITQLPDSQQPGPGNLPQIPQIDPQKLEADWKRHAEPVTPAQP